MDLEKYKKSYQEIEKLQQTKNLDYYRHPARYYVKPFKIVGNLYYIGDQKVCSHLSTRETASSCSTVAFSTAST